jgi:uncharacterized membrane protein YdbT with pleckstrin-like domain
VAPAADTVSEEVFFHGHPSWRSAVDFYAKGIVAAVIAGAIAGVATAIASGHVITGWVVAAVLVVFAVVLVVGVLRRVRTTYTITSERLTIQHGFLGRELHETRLERVQNVRSRQSILQRLLRVGAVEFDTAGGAEFDFAFRGIANPRRVVRTVDRALRQSGELSRTSTSRGP